MSILGKRPRVIIACVCLFWLSNATAQTVLEEIIVTATKRGEISVQEIPIAIKAVTGDFLEDQDIRTFEDVARLEPSFQTARQGTDDLQPIIRGIQSPGAGTVGVYFDETVLNGLNFDDGGGRVPDIGAYDIARVEILKGPQGTLFGASSMTGTVRLISNKPDSDGFDADLAVRGSTIEDGDPGYGVNGMINVPVAEGTLALRGVGWHERSGGFINEFVGLNADTEIEDANELEKSGGRIMARFTPNDRLTLDAFGLYQKTDDDGPRGYSRILDGNSVPITIVGGAPFLIGLVVPPLPGVAGERIVTTRSSEVADSEIEMYGVTAEYDLGFGSVLGTISKYGNDFYYLADTTGIATAFGLIDFGAFFGAGVLVPPAPFALEQNQDRDLWSTEIRFSSDFEGPLNFIAGFFYQDDEQDTETMVVLADTATGEALCKNHAECIADPSSAAAQTIVFGVDELRDFESFALFGHADYELTEALTLGGGVRYYETDLSGISVALQNFQGSVPFTVPPAFGGPVQTVPIIGAEITNTESEVTWDASLSYRHTDEQLYYFRAATGFRQGGLNNPEEALQLGIIIPPAFDPDTVLNLEVGAKTTWFDDRLSANAAYFKMFWEDIQVSGQDPTGSVNFVDNGAKAEIDGVELELNARPTDQWLLTFGLTWLDARLTEDQEVDDPLGLGFPSGRDGDDIPKVPEWGFSGSVDYTFPAQFIANVDTVLRANFSYTGDSDRQLNDSFDNNFEIGDYFLLNLSANFLYRNWELRIFANNVTDEVAVIDVFGNGADPQHHITTEPRSVGVQIRWHYQ